MLFALIEGLNLLVIAVLSVSAYIILLFLLTHFLRKAVTTFQLIEDYSKLHMQPLTHTFA